MLRMEQALARIALVICGGMGLKKEGNRPFEWSDFMPFPVIEQPEDRYATKEEIMAMFPIRKPH